MATYYRQVRDLMAWRDEEGAAWDRLASLDGPTRPFSEAEAVELRRDVVRVAHIHSLIVSNGRLQLDRMRQLGVRLPPPRPPVITCGEITAS